MPWTNFPFGISLTTATGTVAGQLNASNITVTSSTNAAVGTITAGTVSSGAIIASGNITATTFTMSTVTTNTMIGERAYIPFSFTSAATTAYLALPFPAQVIDCWTTCDTTPRTCAGLTLFSGNSASGTVCVATVALVFATAIGQQVQPTLTPAAAITATALCFVVLTAGSAANFAGTVVIRRTA